MKQYRSVTQILYGHLPGQTVDLERGIWRIAEWRSPVVQPCEDVELRAELLRQVTPWEMANRDEGFAADVRNGSLVELVSLSTSGVLVDRFPRVYVCGRCGRMGRDPQACCGSGPKRQFQFVAYHDCGFLDEPYVPRCPHHNQVRVHNPGTASVRDMIFECPTCHRLLGRGFPFRRCGCGEPVKHTVHKATSVFTPRSAVVVNASHAEVRDAIRTAGGGSRALEWVVSGMTTREVTEMRKTRSVLIAELMQGGLSEAVAKQSADLAVASGDVDPDVESIVAEPADPDAARREALTIASALYGARTMLGDVAGLGSDGPARVARYTASFEAAGIESIDLVDRFRILSAVYGYTRGAIRPGDSTLNTFRRPGSNAYAVHVDRAETEALFVRLDPLAVYEWLTASLGFELEPAGTPEEARRAILEDARWPNLGDDPRDRPTLGEAVLSLVHSYCHKLLRTLPVLAGIDRDSLSELLVPAHLGFFVYAAPRGAFVLGGLQALYETDLDVLVDRVASAERRCAMDPGCEKSGAACACCLHVGEPSCRWYNRHLDRRHLRGYLACVARRRAPAVP